MTATVHSEKVWKTEFLKYFQRFLGDTWFLCRCNEKDTVPEKWRRFRDSAKVRFCCDTCNNGWTSMKGRIVFWFYLDYKTRLGYCLFKLYGQKCKKCNKNAVFEAPMWYPEEITKVIFNVYNRIGEVYYRFAKSQLLVDRRDGKPRLQHNRDLCQACQTGECWNGPGDIVNAEGQHLSKRVTSPVDEENSSGVSSPAAADLDSPTAAHEDGETSEADSGTCVTTPSFLPPSEQQQMAPIGHVSAVNPAFIYPPMYTNFMYPPPPYIKSPTGLIYSKAPGSSDMAGVGGLMSPPALNTVNLLHAMNRLYIS